MTTLVDALAAEHAEYGTELDELLQLAGNCRDLQPPELLDEVDRTLTFLTSHLLPHASAEERVLYPAVAAALGAPDATATMLRDHVEIRRLIEGLRRHRDEIGTAVLPAARHELERILYALHAVLSLHIAKEDELYLPLLAATLDGAASAALLGAMRDAVVADGLAADGG